MERGVSRGLLVLFALVLPFEVRLFRVGPLEITTVELILYALIASWGALAAAEAWRDGSALRRAAATVRRDAMVQAALLWCVVLFLSALAAPSYRSAALKFTLRSFSGVLAFFAARDLARAPDVRRRVLWAVVAGAVLSAATAALDALAPSSASVWQLFREGAFDILGLPRPSGVFAYPTIGAMYWEAAVPLLVVAPFIAGAAIDGRRAKRAAFLAVLGSALLIGAILASATRSGLAGTGVACVALLGLARGPGPWVRRATAGVIGVLVVASAATLTTAGPESLLSQRLRWWRDNNWFRVEYLVETSPRAVHAGDVFTVPVTVRNTGAITWPRGGPHPTHVAYHWEPLRGGSTLGDFEGQRTELPEDVPPGGVLEIVCAVRAPASQGSYRLQWDVVQEEVTWFSDQGNVMPEQRVDVGPPAEGVTLIAGAEIARPILPPPPPARTTLWRAAVALWRTRPLLGVGPDNFRRRYEAVLSPAPTGQPYTDTRIHANSLYFETLADLGLGGVAALAWIIAAWVRIVRGHVSRGASSDLAGIGLSVAAATFFVHGSLDYFFEFTPLFGLFWLLLGLSAAGEESPASSARRRSMP